MAKTLRRSRRATKKGVSDYNVGDIVEIDRQHGVIARGRLAQLLTEGPSPNPRWLVKFDSQPYKDEEMYERAFGKIPYSAEENEEQQSPIANPEPTSSGTTRGKTSMTTVDAASDEKGQWTFSEEERSDDGKKGKNSNDESIEVATENTNSRSRAVQFQRASATFSQDSADDSSPTEEASRSRASAREARSRRRQAMIDDAAIVPGTEILAGKRKIPPPPGNRSKQYKSNEVPYAEEGEVVKVKLLTGTLYLYRGEQRRVEFVRRV
mmetsp:Transcript_19413/g.40869  ORF Transcript_19413/g.40869 Transcript_19413/m.40869 type:complete len:266 (+) Transcript_19413:167-964(+)